MKKIESWKLYTILIIVIVIGCIYINNIKSNINYSDVPCVNCGSNEVLNFGFNEKMHMNENYCSDCDLTFYSD